MGSRAGEVPCREHQRDRDDRCFFRQRDDAPSTSTGTGSGGTTSSTAGASKTIAIGTAGVGRVTVNASPATVPSSGGSSTISASVFDINGNALPAAPVSFSTTAGTLSSTLVSSDSSGIASTTLTTSLQATVTASVGGQSGTGTGGGTGTGTGTGAGGSSGQASGSVTVNVSAIPVVVITAPATSPSAGLPASFTFTVTVAAQNGSAVKDLFVTWGDGDSVDLGAVTGAAPASHVYLKAGTYVVTATVTDASGNSNKTSSTVVVIPVARPTVIVTPTPQSAPGGSTISISINITVPNGIQIQNVHIDFGDGFSQDLGGFSGVQTVPHPYPAGPRSYTITVDVTDSTNTTTRGSAVVSITT